MKYLKYYEENDNQGMFSLDMNDKFKNYIGNYVIYENPYRTSGVLSKEIEEKYNLVKFIDINLITQRDGTQKYFVEYDFVHFIYNGEKIHKDQLLGSTTIDEIKIYGVYDTLEKAKKEWKILKEIEKFNL